MGLFKDQAVGKLVEVLQELPADKRDEAVVKAKNRLTEEAKRVIRESLEKLLDSQIKTLQDCGCPKQIVAMFQNQRPDVLEKAMEVWAKHGFEPIESLAAKGIHLTLPVIPRTYLSIYTQMSMVRNGSKTGFAYLEPAEITDVVEMPAKPYYIFDIKDGEAMRDKTPQDAEKLIKEQGRRGLTEVEVISLGVHTDVLSRHYIDAVGSRCGSDGVPYLYLFDDRPGLNWGCLGSVNSVWGAASCGSN